MHKIVYKRVGQPPEVSEVSEITADVIKQGIGGGWLEAMRWGMGIICWLDEEGLLKDLPSNFPVKFAPGSPLGDGQIIAGDVVFTGHTPVNCEEVGLTSKQVEYILEYFARIPDNWEQYIPSDWYEPKMVFESFSNIETFIKHMTGG